MYFYLMMVNKRVLKTIKTNKTIFSLGSESKEMLFVQFFIELISFFFQLFLSPLIYMARAIFGTYPEIEFFNGNLEIAKVKNFFYATIFLTFPIVQEEIRTIQKFFFSKNFWKIKKRTFFVQNFLRIFF